MLYLFAGYPPHYPDAGLVRSWVNQENIGLLEESPNVQYRREGKFLITDSGEEQIAEQCVVLSPSLQWLGLSLNDLEGFPVRVGHDFGNGVTINSQVGVREPLARLAPFRENAWQGQDFERSIWLSWCAFTHELPNHAYEKLLRMMEGQCLYRA